MSETLELHLGWRAQNGLIKYPFLDTCSVRSLEGVEIPDNVFLDAVVIFIRDSQVSVTRIEAVADTVTITLQNEIETEKATASFVLNGTQDVADLIGSNGYTKMGILVCDPAALVTWISSIRGVLTFRPADTLLTPRCLHNYSPQAVTSISPDGAEGQTGNVFLIGEDGVVLRHVTTETIQLADPFIQDMAGIVAPVRRVNRIRVDVVGDPLKNAALCDAGAVGLTNLGLYAETVNTMRPDANGVIQLIADRRFGSSAFRAQVGVDPSEVVLEIIGATS